MSYVYTDPTTRQRMREGRCPECGAGVAMHDGWGGPYGCTLTDNGVGADEMLERAAWSVTASMAIHATALETAAATLDAALPGWRDGITTEWGIRFHDPGDRERVSKTESRQDALAAAAYQTRRTGRPVRAVSSTQTVLRSAWQEVPE